MKLKTMVSGIVLLALVVTVGCESDTNEQSTQTPADKSPTIKSQSTPVPTDLAEIESGQWVSMFDGKTLARWEVPNCGIEGTVSVKDGIMHIARGDGGTFVKWTGTFPKTNFEIELEAARLEDYDFFCGLTFPVGKGHCSLILGGWTGEVTGISCIDNNDASANMTTANIIYKNKQWYKVLVRVSDKEILVWLDGKQIIQHDRKGHTFDIRPEVEACLPMGLATWNTHGGVRNIRMRKL